MYQEPRTALLSVIPVLRRRRYHAVTEVEKSFRPAKNILRTILIHVNGMSIIKWGINHDGLVKSQVCPIFVIPAKAGI